MPEMRTELKVSVHYVPHEDKANGHCDKSQWTKEYIE